MYIKNNHPFFLNGNNYLQFIKCIIAYDKKFYAYHFYKKPLTVAINKILGNVTHSVPVSWM